MPDKGSSLAFAVTALIFVFLVIAHAVLLFANIYPDLAFVFHTSVDLPLQIIGAILILLAGVPGLWGPLSLGEFTGDFRLAKEQNRCE